MIMTATVIQADPRSLLVIDSETNQEVLVFYQNANRFSPGDIINITFSGAMTLSIPPQITATFIERARSTAPPPSQSVPSQMRAVVLQRSNNSLLVRNVQTNRQVRVSYDCAHHFCVGQRIIISYDTIFLDTVSRIDAIDIRPVC